MKRPAGITILALLYFVGGIVILGLQVVFHRQLAAGFDSIGVSATVAYLGVLFLAAIGIAAGIGMWLGKGWGWWLGAFYLTYSVARSISALLSLPGLIELHGEPSGGAWRYYFKFGGRVVVHSLICWYFFTPKVEEYFRATEFSRKKRLTGLVVATAGISAAFHLLNALT